MSRLSGATSVDQLDAGAATTVAAGGILDALAECLADARAATRPGPLLEALADARMAVNEAIESAAIEAHCAGQSWTSIGSALGITRQGAAKVYGAAAEAEMSRRLHARFTAQRGAGQDG